MASAIVSGGEAKVAAAIAEARQGRYLKLLKPSLRPFEGSEPARMIGRESVLLKFDWLEFLLFPRS
jgi:hypothetical protein